MKARLDILIGMETLESSLQTEDLLRKAGHHVGAIAMDEKAVVSHVSHSPPDLILLDVRLKGRGDGIEAAQRVQKLGPFPLIFLSTCDKESTFERAKSALPYAFLHKPIKPKELLRLVDLATSQPFYQQKIQGKSSIPVLKDCLFIRKNERLEKLRIEDIYYIEAARNYCKIVAGTKDFVLSLPLKSLADQLCKNQFQRIHRSYLVNLKYVESLDERHVYIQGKSLPISKSNRGALFQRLRMP